MVELRNFIAETFYRKSIYQLIDILCLDLLRWRNAIELLYHVGGGWKIETKNAKICFIRTFHNDNRWFNYRRYSSIFVSLFHLKNLKFVQCRGKTSLKMTSRYFHFTFKKHKQLFGIILIKKKELLKNIIALTTYSSFWLMNILLATSIT